MDTRPATSPVPYPSAQPPRKNPVRRSRHVDAPVKPCRAERHLQVVRRHGQKRSGIGRASMRCNEEDHIAGVRGRRARKGGGAGWKRVRTPTSGQRTPQHAQHHQAANAASGQEGRGGGGRRLRRGAPTQQEDALSWRPPPPPIAARAAHEEKEQRPDTAPLHCRNVAGVARKRCRPRQGGGVGVRWANKQGLRRRAGGQTPCQAWYARHP